MQKDLNHFLNISAVIILAVCVVGMISVAFRCFRCSVPQTHRIILTVSPDSAYNEQQFSYYTDSLITVINKHEHIIADRYEAILEERADAQRYWSLAGILISIIIGVAGFFGFKTIKDIEHACQETAEKLAKEIAASVAKDISKDRTEEYLKQHLREGVLNASDVYLGNQEKYVSDMVNDAIANNLKDCSSQLDELTGEMEGIEKRLDKIENSINVDEKTNASAPSDSNEQPVASSASDETDLFE